MISRNNSIEKFFFFFFNIMDELIYEDTDKTIVSGYSGLGGPVIIPEGVTTIAYRALADMTGITSFTLPSTLTTIGEYSFSGNAITSIVFPASVTNIGNLAFFNNTNLTTVVSWKQCNAKRYCILLLFGTYHNQYSCGMVWSCKF